MPLEPFDELDQAGLRVLGFTIDVTRDGELAFVAGQMQVLLHRSGIYADQLTLIITAQWSRVCCTCPARRIEGYSRRGVRRVKPGAGEILNAACPVARSI
jgi:hypothetical protein